MIDITQRRYQQLLKAEQERDDYVTAVQRMARETSERSFVDAAVGFDVRYYQGWRAAMQKFNNVLLGVMAERAEEE